MKENESWSRYGEEKDISEKIFTCLAGEVMRRKYDIETIDDLSENLFKACISGNCGRRNVPEIRSEQQQNFQMSDHVRH